MPTKRGLGHHGRLYTTVILRFVDRHTPTACGGDLTRVVAIDRVTPFCSEVAVGGLSDDAAIGADDIALGDIGRQGR